jgi:hypothetical protein
LTTEPEWGGEIADRNALGYAFKAPGVQVQSDDGRGIHKQSDGDQDQAAVERMPQDPPRGFAALKAGGKREHHRDAHQKQKRREDEVGRSPAIPVGVLDRTIGQVVAAGVVDHNHSGDGESAENIQAKQPFGGGLGGFAQELCPIGERLGR